MLKKTTISLIVLSNVISFNLSANASTAIYDQEKSLFIESGRPKDAFTTTDPLSADHDSLPPSVPQPPHTQSPENSINILPANELRPGSPTAL